MAYTSSMASLWVKRAAWLSLAGLWMGLIFYLSSRPSIPVAVVEAYERERMTPQPSYHPDDNSTSDHRPELAEFRAEAPADAGRRNQVLQQLEVTERELEELRRLIESME